MSVNEGICWVNKSVNSVYFECGLSRNRSTSLIYITDINTIHNTNVNNLSFVMTICINISVSVNKS